MSKYSFARMQPIEFESMAQALLEKIYRIDGNLIQFGPGQDGGREATWAQSPEHPQYCRPANQETDIVKQWVFQVKYHDLDQRGWSNARDAVLADLDKELEKIVHKYTVPCNAYVMITNVPFTGARNIGTRDQATALAKKWSKQIPDIYIWDSADLSRMLDSNEDVRTAYLDTILVGDTLKALYSEATFKASRKQSAFKAYLKFVTVREGAARAEEAGDDPDLPLSEVFIDLTLKFQDGNNEVPTEWLSRKTRLRSDTDTVLLPESLTQVRASFALFFADYPYTLLLGGPGLGKSTLTQFLSLYQAARIVDPELALRLANRLKLPKGISAEDLDSYSRPRFPFRIELRRYAKWMSQQQDSKHELARYIVEKLVNSNTSATLEMDDVFELSSKDPILLILDGLDEVPNLETRQQIIENLQIFLYRIESEKGDIQVILSSRPKGYSGEFEGFKPITWELNELERSDFDEYCDCWLRSRIRDADERSEAKERISRGMLAEAVQRLARSLLQATVILTIVRNKIEIPHQRNSLYQKYVEVIFNREKEKSEIVSEREKELLRLHERIGYELHCKMEQTRVDALDSETFRNYVLSVLEDYSAPQLGNKTFRAIADEIIDAAKDRLCLLVGKGKDQTDVDFVVQQYREYFAAVYLSNHPDADPDRVFDMLVRRGAYWAYVLQFYIAQANTNQQMRWVTGIPDQCDDEDYIEALVRRTRTYRAILSVLPEFTLQRKSDFERALKIIFSLETRWTWLEHEAIVGILSLIPSLDIFQVLKRMFGAFSIEDTSTLAVELWLLVELSSSCSMERLDLCNRITDLLSRNDTQMVALCLAFQNDLEVDLSGCDFSEVELAFDQYYYEEIRKRPHERRNQLHHLLAYQTKEKKCELLLSLGSPWVWNNASFPLSIKTLGKILFPGVELSILADAVELRIRPYLCRTIDKVTLLKSFVKKLGESAGPYSDYLRSLAQAIQQPEDDELDGNVRLIESQVLENVSYMWRTDFVLGPSVSDFASVELWKKFKQQIISYCIEDPKWLTKIADFRRSENLWICFFFHPDHWELLLEEELITEDEYYHIMNTPLGSILQLPKVPLDLFQGISSISESSRKFPFHKILRVVLDILENEGFDRISKARGLDGILLYNPEMQPVTKEEAESLLGRANKLTSLPSLWVTVLLRLCAEVPELSIDLLLDFWDKNQHVHPRLFAFHVEELPGSWNHLLKKLLDNDRKSALRLGIAIAACSEPCGELQVPLRDRLLAEFNKYIYDEYALSEMYCRALFNLQPSLEEFSLWAQPGAINQICKSPWLLNRLSTRFARLPHPKSKLNYSDLRKQLLPFIANRHDYPAIIPLKALEAVLKIDELNLPAVNCKMWYQTFEE